MQQVNKSVCKNVFVLTFAVFNVCMIVQCFQVEPSTRYIYMSDDFHFSNLSIHFNQKKNFGKGSFRAFIYQLESR